MQITNDIWQVGGAGYTSTDDAAVYLMRIDGRAAIVDAGCGGQGNRLAANIRDCGIGAEQVDYLLLTHCHFDHSGGAEELKQRFDCAVVAHESDAAALEDGNHILTAAHWYGAVLNPLTDKTETFTKDFSYEVGQPSVNVSADKMNVFYVGVDNPVTVAAAGVTTSSMKVSMTGGTLTKKSGTSYVVTASKPTNNAVITVKDTKNNKNFPFTFRVKRIPDPVVRLGKQTDGLIGSGEMKAQPGLAAWLDNFDFDAKCNVQSYTMYYTRKRQDPVEIEGKGGRFSGKVGDAIRQAKPGDQYAFTNVKARCPGDSAARRVNGLAFKIK